MMTPVELFVADVEWLANHCEDNDTMQVGAVRLCEDGRGIDRLEAAVTGLLGQPLDAVGLYDQDENCEGA